MKRLTFFIPHYADHKRLETQLRLAEKFYSFPRRYIIYDSSPNPIGRTSITHLLGANNFTYREKKYDIEGNTYAYVLRDFLLSEDSDNGAFILPHDELLYIEGEDFMNISPSTPFACGTQLSYCPDSKKIAEYINAPYSTYNIKNDNLSLGFLPQYHSTYIPPEILKPLGKFIAEFLYKWGNTNSVFIDFVLLDLLNRVNIYYSKPSVYIQERRKKRKTLGSFNHPYIFTKNQDEKSKNILKRMLEKLWESISILPPKHSEQSIKRLLDHKILQKTLLMTGVDRHIHLFKFDIDSISNFHVVLEDTFCGYFVMNKKLTSKHLEFIFEDKTCLEKEIVLSCLWELIESY